MMMTLIRRRYLAIPLLAAVTFYIFGMRRCVEAFLYDTFGARVNITTTTPEDVIANADYRRHLPHLLAAVFGARHYR